MIADMSMWFWYELLTNGGTDGAGDSIHSRVRRARRRENPGLPGSNSSRVHRYWRDHVDWRIDAVRCRCRRSLGVFFALLSVLCLWGAACKESATPRTPGRSLPAPIQEIEWTGIVAFAEWGEAGGGLFGVSTDYRLDSWKWEKATLNKEVVAQLPRSLDVVPLPGGVYLASISSEDGSGSWPLALASTGPKGIIEKWDPPGGWLFHRAGASGNGRFACVILEQDTDHRNWENPQRRVGLLNVQSVDLRWVAELNGQGDGTVRQIRVSDNGQYVAVAGWKNGTAVLDAVHHKVLWVERPPEAISIGYVMFSVDGETLYEADAGGECMYTVKTKTGEVLRRTYLTESGKPGQGRRVSCLAVSPDGVWAAAGTGPDGQVFLFRTDAPSAKPIVLPHGHSTILVVSFSPDSAHVASVAGGMIKIWAVPGGGSSRPATQPISSRPSSAPEEATRVQ